MPREETNVGPEARATAAGACGRCRGAQQRYIEEGASETSAGDRAVR